MNQYEHSLLAMKRLLEAVGESHWAKWIDTCITAWRLKRDAAHHLSAYCGVGSFNDIWIHRANQHIVTELQEPWANALFEWLKSLCHFLAQHANDSFTATMLAQRIGKHDSALVAFFGDQSLPASMRCNATEDRELHGWRCLHCGHAEASSRGIENLIAQDLVPAMAFESCERWNLDELVDRVLVGDIPDLENMRQSLVAALKNSGIVLLDRDGWMRPCPNCKRDETAVYRWRLAMNSVLRFEPSNDNLPMRK